MQTSHRSSPTGLPAPPRSTTTAQDIYAGYWINIFRNDQVEGFQVQVQGQPQPSKFGRCFKATRTNGATTQHYVIKIVSVGSEGEYWEVMKGIDLMIALRGHENILRYEGCSERCQGRSQTRDWLYDIFILTEDYDFSSSGPIANEIDDKIHLCKSACKAISFLHSHSPQILHRALEPRSIVKVHNTYKLAYLISAATFQYKDPSSNIGEDIECYSPRGYRAPELYNRRLTTSTVTPAADVWSLGRIMDEFIASSTPLPQHLDGCQSLIDRMMATDPQARPRISEAIRFLEQATQSTSELPSYVNTSALVSRPYPMPRSAILDYTSHLPIPPGSGGVVGTRISTLHQETPTEGLITPKPLGVTRSSTNADDLASGSAPKIQTEPLKLGRPANTTTISYAPISGTASGPSSSNPDSLANWRRVQTHTSKSTTDNSASPSLSQTPESVAFAMGGPGSVFGSTPHIAHDSLPHTAPNNSPGPQRKTSSNTDPGAIASRSRLGRPKGNTDPAE